MEKDYQKNIVNNFEPGCNCHVYNAPISGYVFAMPGATVNQQVPEETKTKTKTKTKDDEQPDVTTLAACVDDVRQFFWGDSSLAVIFCTCRDCYGSANNMSQFERDFHCQEGLLSNAFRNNPYMRLHIDKWAQQGVKQRVLRLMEAYKEAVENRLIT